MDPVLKLTRKCRPSLNDCGVKPLTREMHEYLVSSYLVWPLIAGLGNVGGSIVVLCSIVATFLVLGFLFYNLLVALVQMSHDDKKRLRISQAIFCLTFLVLAIRIGWLLS
ncbi:MAG: hypothetical protein H7A51_05350 [Akkermansiaceae bacterium]|nr:hypothetical protein [Akkermansiaceae bacterium]